MGVNENVETYTNWRDYYELTKPRVVMLIVFTAIVGMFLAVPGMPPASALLFGTRNKGDEPTQRSADELVEPLAEYLAKYVEDNPEKLAPDWKIAKPTDVPRAPSFHPPMP